MTSKRRSTKGASRLICSVVAPDASTITRLGYAWSGSRSKSPAAGLCGAVGRVRFELAVADTQRDLAGDIAHDFVDGAALAGDVQDADLTAVDLDPVVRRPDRVHQLGEEVEVEDEGFAACAVPHGHRAASGAEKEVARMVEVRGGDERVCGFEAADERAGLAVDDRGATVDKRRGDPFAIARRHDECDAPADVHARDFFAVLDPQHVAVIRAREDAAGTDADTDDVLDRRDGFPAIRADRPAEHAEVFL